MKLKLKRYGILMGVITLILVSILAIQVNAEEPTTGSITIIAHEQQNGDTTTNPPMEGIEYIIYKVDERCEDDGDAWDYIEENQIEGISNVTDENGTIIFDNLELGRYFIELSEDMYDRDDILIWLTDASSFLVDIPMTNPQGNGLIYDITVEPKFPVVLSNLLLMKVDASNNPIENVTFKLQIGWGGGQRDDVISNSDNESLKVTTDEYGIIELENLPYLSDWHRKIVEVSAPDGYIINNAILSMLEFRQDHDGTIYNSMLYGIQYGYYKNTIFDSIIKYVEISNNLTGFTYVNEKPEIVKKSAK